MSKGLSIVEPLVAITFCGFGIEWIKIYDAHPTKYLYDRFRIKTDNIHKYIQNDDNGICEKVMSVKESISFGSIDHDNLENNIRYSFYLDAHMDFVKNEDTDVALIFNRFCKNLIKDLNLYPFYNVDDVIAKLYINMIDMIGKKIFDKSRMDPMFGPGGPYDIITPNKED